MKEQTPVNYILNPLWYVSGIALLLFVMNFIAIMIDKIQVEQDYSIPAFGFLTLFVLIFAVAIFVLGIRVEVLGSTMKVCAYFFVIEKVEIGQIESFLNFGITVGMSYYVTEAGARRGLTIPHLFGEKKLKKSLVSINPSIAF